MGKIRLFRYDDSQAEELCGKTVGFERSLQTLVEKHLEEFFGIRLLAHEYNTGRGSRGQIDSLGLDENCSPVIIEYKRHSNENIINQGLYYLDWLLDHQAEFVALVEARFGREEAQKVDFSWPRILCIASDFSRFDEKAVLQIDRGIELVRYKLFGDDLALFESLNSLVTLPVARMNSRDEDLQEEVGMPLPLQARLRSMSHETERLYLDVLTYAESLGEDVVIRFLKHYVAFSRLKIFTCLQPAKTFLKLWLNLDPDSIDLEAGFSRDVRLIGHHASGNLEIDLHNFQDLEKARPLIEQAYQEN